MISKTTINLFKNSKCYTLLKLTDTEMEKFAADNKRSGFHLFNVKKKCHKFLDMTKNN